MQRNELRGSAFVSDPAVALAVPDETYEFKLSEDFAQLLASKNSVATTLYFEQLSEAIFTHLVGLPPTGKRKASKPAGERPRGIFGRCFRMAQEFDDAALVKI